MKIDDRLFLGVIAGIAATTVKTLLLAAAKKYNLTEFNGMETSAGILLPGHKITTPQGKAIGFIAENFMGSILGVATAYILSVTGRDKALFKGAALGGIAWLALYGAIKGMGASSVKPAMPKTVLSQLGGHLAFGLTAASIITLLGERGLFEGRIPLSAGSKTQEAQGLAKYDAANGADLRH